MITVEDFTTAVQFKITGGSSFQWHCFGPDARYLDADDDQTKQTYSTNIVFGGPDFTVYIAEAYDYTNNRAYRLINPDFKDAYFAECAEREVDPHQALEDQKFIDLETDEDFLEKCAAIVAGEPYDDRIVVPLDIPDADLLQFMLAAHERNMTFNAFVEEALKAAVEDFQRDPEGMKDRAQRWVNSQK